MNIIINQKYTLSGAQLTIAFLRMLYKAWEEVEVASKIPDVAAASGNGILYVDDSCTIPQKSN